MRRLLPLAVLLIIPLLSVAQNKQIVVRSFEASNIADMRARTSPVYDNNNQLAALIEITFAGADTTAHFEGIIGKPIVRPNQLLIRVPEGVPRIIMSIPGFKPLTFRFPVRLIPISGQVYKLDLEIVEPAKRRNIIIPTFSYNQAQNSYGLLLGICKENGMFVRIKSDFSTRLNPTADCTAEGTVNGVKGWFTGEAETNRVAITAGYLRHLFNFSKSSATYIYVGGGYGSRVLAWRMFGINGEYEYARVATHSFNGYEAEAGLILRLGGFALSAGVQTNQFKYFEANVGLGIMF